MTDLITIIQSIYFLLNKNDCVPMDKIKIVKLMYLSDKYHLLKYGRTITNDSFYAMRHGPVGSTTLDVLNLDKVFDPEAAEYAKKLFEKKTSYTYASIKNAECDFNRLSKSDKEALAYIYKSFKDVETDDLVEFSHKYPEWKQYEAFLAENRSSRGTITTMEVASRIEGDPFNDIDAEHIKESLLILNHK